MQTDAVAKEIVRTRWAIPDCLHVPIAAVNEDAISTFIGDVVEVLSKGKRHSALLVRIGSIPPRDDRLPIWDLEASEIFHARNQVWVHYEYTRYRAAYQRAFPEEEIKGRVLSHAMNRRMAALMGFQYVRVTPASRAANSSSAYSEEWGVGLRSAPGMTPDKSRRGAYIHYADLSALMLMMDIGLGGGVMDVVNDGQALVKPRQT